MNYIISLNCRIDARTAEEAKSKAVSEIKVREAAPLVAMPMAVYEQLKNIRCRQKEHFIVLLLNTQNEIIGREIVSVGTINCSIVHPREVYQPALMAGCSHIILSHNHPSGGLLPSVEDQQVTKRLQSSGKLLGVEMIDHVIVSQDGYYSFREHNLL